MTYLVAVLVGVVLLALAFLIWRRRSVERGGASRDERVFELIEPLYQRLESGEEVSVDDVRELAQQPQVRYHLFGILRDLDRPDLLPDDFSSTVQQAESCLTYWMMHPNELQDPPEEMELVETVDRSVDGVQGAFHVFRYRMPEGHWAEKDGWLLGFAGPYFLGKEPYEELSGAFSRADDRHGSIEPAAIVDWYLDMLRRKGL